MPKYFFNIHHESEQPDLVGEDLADENAAWKEATVTAGQMIQNIDGRLKPGQDWRMQVTDGSDNVLFELLVSARKPK